MPDPLEMMRQMTAERSEAIRNAKPREPGAYIEPLNPYTGEVSLMAIMKNIENGHTSFPEGLGETRQIVVDKHGNESFFTLNRSGQPQEGA